MDSDHRDFVCDRVCTAPAGNGARAAVRTSPPRRTGQARHARNVELCDSCPGATGLIPWHSPRLTDMTSILVSVWGSTRCGRVSGRLRFRERQRSPWLALVEADQRKHPNTRERGLARHGPIRPMRPSRILRDSFLFTGRVTPFFFPYPLSAIC